jgi:hypothetical protein
MYAVHHRRHANSKYNQSRFHDSQDNVVVIAKNLPTLEAAEKARQMSGDLVVWQDTGKVVNDEAWLFGWESLDVNCYARKAMRHDNP